MSSSRALISKAVQRLCPRFFDRLKEQESSDDSLAIYVGSTPVDTWLPGFRGANDIEIPAEEALVSFWLGNLSKACLITAISSF